MIPDQLRPRYHLLKQIAGGPVSSYQALDSTGATVMVHVVHGAPAECRARLARCDRLRPEARATVLEVVETEAGAAIVTRLLPGFESLDQWLEAAAASGIADGPDTIAEPARGSPFSQEPDRPGPGEFTRLFGAPAPGAPMDPPADARAGPSSSSPDGLAPAARAETELPRREPAFARLFGPATAAGDAGDTDYLERLADRTPVPAPPLAAAPPPSTGAASSPPAPAPAGIPATPTPVAPSDFTRMIDGPRPEPSLRPAAELVASLPRTAVPSAPEIDAPSTRLLLAAMGAVLLAAMGLVLYFVFVGG